MDNNFETLTHSFKCFFLIALYHNDKHFYKDIYINLGWQWGDQSRPVLVFDFYLRHIYGHHNAQGFAIESKGWKGYVALKYNGGDCQFCSAKSRKQRIAYNIICEPFSILVFMMTTI